MSVAWPTLSRGISFENFRESLADDPTIRTKFEDGTVLTRARFTSQKKTFDYTMRYIPAADVTLLETMQTNANVGADTLTGWTHPQTDTSYTVRLAAPLQFALEPREPDYYSCRISLVEV